MSLAPASGVLYSSTKEVLGSTGGTLIVDVTKQVKVTERPVAKEV